MMHVQKASYLAPIHLSFPANVTWINGRLAECEPLEKSFSQPYILKHSFLAQTQEFFQKWLFARFTLPCDLDHSNKANLLSNQRVKRPCAEC